jgi:DNA-binding XRE family transcriptional regulator
MMHAYDRNLLGKAQITLASMIDCVVNVYGIELKRFYSMFLNSEISSAFSRGDSGTVAGKSGRELAYTILSDSYPEIEVKISYENHGRSKEYWIGWALAYYQWYSGLSFKKINEMVDISEVEKLYAVCHEMDIEQFVERIEMIRGAGQAESALKRLRAYAGLSQRELAERSGIPLRTIQQYEQGQKDIAHARADSILRLSKELYCSPEELIAQS